MYQKKILWSISKYFVSSNYFWDSAIFCGAEEEGRIFLMGSAARKLPLPAIPALGDGAANDHDRTRKPALRFFTKAGIASDSICARTPIRRHCASIISVTGLAGPQVVSVSVKPFP